MQEPDDRPVNSPLTLSMLTSEWVYRLICLVERGLRWLIRAVIRPYYFLLRLVCG